jgi:hypothetical protein
VSLLGVVCGLVAHPSGSSFLADALGFSEPFIRYPDERSAVSDALTYADQTVGIRGERLTIHADG